MSSYHSASPSSRQITKTIDTSDVDTSDASASGVYSSDSHGPPTIDSSDYSFYSSGSHGPPTIDPSVASSAYSAGSRGPPTIDPSVASGAYSTGSRGTPAIDPSGASALHSKGHSEENVDEEGRCAKHPHIRLRKKKMLGGWKVLLANCPDCCAEEMRRMRLEGSAAKDVGRARGNSDSAPHLGGGQPRRPDPPISELNFRTRDHDDSDAESSSSQGSEITSYSQQQVDSGAQRVNRMPFTDAYGEKGWYTGDVAGGSGLPHGQGRMIYLDGRTMEGWWSNGLAGGEPKKARGKRSSVARMGQGGSSASSQNTEHSSLAISPNHLTSGQLQQHQKLMAPPQHQKQQPFPQSGNGPVGAEGACSTPHRKGLHHKMTHEGMRTSSNLGVSSRNTHNSFSSSSLKHPLSRQPLQQQKPVVSSELKREQSLPQQRPPLALARDAVFNLEWTDLQGKAGYYTGEIDETGEPHGMGSMRYANSETLVEGEWYHGVIERQMHQHGVVNVGGRGGERSRSGGRSTGRNGGSRRSNHKRAAGRTVPPRWGEEARRRNQQHPLRARTK